MDVPIKASIKPSASSESPTQAAALGRAGLAAFLLAAILWSVRLARGYTSIGHDQSWLLYAGQLVLQGVRVAGPHLSETNPPLIIWFSTMPDLLARMLSLPPALGFFLFVLVTAVGSCLWCFWLLQRGAPGQGLLQRVLLTGSIFFVECHVPWFTDFGQREQFMVILLMPMLVAYGLQRTTSLTRLQLILINVVAAFGVCLKPQHLITLTVLQAAFLLSNKRSLRLASPEVLSLIVTSLVFCAYVGTVYIAAPDYLLDIVPLLRNTYWAFGTQSPLVILFERRFLLFLVVAASAYVYFRNPCSLSRMPLVLLAACAGAHISYAIQRAGWVYQEIPQNAFVVLFGLWVAIEVLCNGYLRDPKRSRISRSRSAGFAASILIFLAFFYAINAKSAAMTYMKERPDSETGTRDFFHALPAQTSVFVFSTELMPAFPAVLEQHLVWAGRSPHLWRLPAIVQNEADPGGTRLPIKHLPPGQVAQMATGLRQDVAADLTYWQPAYVLVPRCTQAMPCPAIVPANFDMLGWFSQNPVFSTAWSAYVFDRTIPDARLHTVWDVYRRR
jgi:hypothetical protein